MITAPDRRPVPQTSPRPCLCRHTGAPTVSTRVSCRPVFVKFDCCHVPCLTLAHSTLGLEATMQDTERTVVPAPRGDHSSILDTTPTGRYCGGMLFPPFSCGAVWSAKVFAHSQVRDSRVPTCSCCGHALEAPSSWPPKQSDVVSRLCGCLLSEGFVIEVP